MTASVTTSVIVSGRRSTTWRVSGTYMVLELGGMVGALRLADRYHLGAAATATSLLPTMAPLFLSWVTFRVSAQRAAEQLLVETAEQLARDVQSQWAAETRVRRLNGRYPLPCPGKRLRRIWQSRGSCCGQSPLTGWRDREATLRGGLRVLRSWAEQRQRSLVCSPARCLSSGCWSLARWARARLSCCCGWRLNLVPN